MIAQAPSTVQELTQFIAEAVRAHFERTGRRMTGAALAEVVRGKYPELDFQRLGLARLADAVRQAEAGGLLVRHRDVKHMEVSPNANTPAAPTANPSGFVRLRAEVWRAFVFVNDPSAHFYDRVTRTLIPVAPTETDQISQLSTSDRYVGISPIPATQQQEWMKQFLATRTALKDLAAPIDVPTWWTAFSGWLRDHSDKDPAAARAWSIYRARRVSEQVTAWATENNVPPSALFLSPRGDDGRRTGYGSDEDANRRAVLATIAEMSYDDLMELRLPLKYVVRHFKAR